MRKTAAQALGRGRNHASSKKQDKQETAAAQATSNNNPKPRKTTPEEAALTAKNYRLAKELSELRVRHREECKNVTRLTMENMNLASRCREAIAQAAALKKDLAAHQRRSAEALAAATSGQQQHKQQPPPPPLAGHVPPAPSTESSTDELDRLVALHNQNLKKDKPKSPVPPGTPPLSPVLSPLDSDDFESPGSGTLSPTATVASTTVAGKHNKPLSPLRIKDKVGTFLAATSGKKEHNNKTAAAAAAPTQVPPAPTTDLVIDTSADLSKEEEDNIAALAATSSTPRSTASPTFFPATASPKMSRQKNNYNEGFPGDIMHRSKPAAQQRMELMGTDFGSSPGLANNGKASSSLQPLNPASVVSGKTGGGAFDKMQRVSDKSTMSSIDAFEASFDITNFPDSFTPKDPIEEKKASSEIYNPFFPSPKKRKEKKEDEKKEAKESTKDTDGHKKYTGSRRKEGLERSKKDRPSTKRDRDKAREDKPEQPLSTKADTPSLAAVLDAGKNSAPTVSDSKHSKGSSSSRATEKARVIGSAKSNSSSSEASTGSEPPSLSTADCSSPAANLRTPPQISYTTSRSLSDDAFKFHTPTQPSPNGTMSSGGSNPRRPEKSTGYDAARARYEKAVQPMAAKAASVNDSVEKAASSSSSAHSRDERPVIDPASDHTRDGAGGGSSTGSLDPAPLSPIESAERIPSLKDRVAAFQQSASPNRDKGNTRNGPSWLGNVTPERRTPRPFDEPATEEPSGDIPMHTNLTAPPVWSPSQAPAQPTPPLSASSKTPSSTGGSRDPPAMRRGRVHPWEQQLELPATPNIDSTSKRRLRMIPSPQLDVSPTPSAVPPLRYSPRTTADGDAILD